MRRNIKVLNYSSRSLVRLSSIIILSVEMMLSLVTYDACTVSMFRVSTAIERNLFPFNFHTCTGFNLKPFDVVADMNIDISSPHLPHCCFRPGPVPLDPFCISTPTMCERSSPVSRQIRSLEAYLYYDISLHAYFVRIYVHLVLTIIRRRTVLCSYC